MLRSTFNKRSKFPNRKSIRLALTTDHIAELLGTTPDNVRHRISRGKLIFTGDPITDFHMLVKLIDV